MNRNILIYLSAVTTSLIVSQTPTLAEKNGFEYFENTFPYSDKSGLLFNNLIEQENLFITLSTSDIDGTCWFFAEETGDNVTVKISFFQDGTYEDIRQISDEEIVMIEGIWRINNNMIEMGYLRATRIIKPENDNTSIHTQQKLSPTWEAAFTLQNNVLILNNGNLRFMPCQ